MDKFYQKGEIHNGQQFGNALDKFCTKSMELRSKLLEQIVFNMRP